MRFALRLAHYRALELMRLALADLRTLISTVDTRESLFDSYTLERIKSALKEWATRDHFPTAIT